MKVPTPIGDGAARASAHAWLRDEFADGIFPGLPWFMGYTRPQGFLGRAFAHHFGLVLGLRKELALGIRMMSSALLLHGDDSAGDFVLGEMTLEHALARDPALAALYRRFG